MHLVPPSPAQSPADPRAPGRAGDGHGWRGLPRGSARLPARAAASSAPHDVAISGRRGSWEARGPHPATWRPGRGSPPLGLGNPGPRPLPTDARGPAVPTGPPGGARGVCGLAWAPRWPGRAGEPQGWGAAAAARPAPLREAAVGTTRRGPGPQTSGRCRRASRGAGKGLGSPGRDPPGRPRRPVLTAARRSAPGRSSPAPAPGPPGIRLLSGSGTLRPARIGSRPARRRDWPHPAQPERQSSSSLASAPAPPPKRLPEAAGTCSLALR